MNLRGKRVVVYGAGVSGLSAAQLVRDHGGRAVIYDDDPTKSHSTSCTSVFNDCDILVLSPGIRRDNPRVLDARLEGKLVIGELELASSFCAAEQIAVTGTNGKTTTTLLIDHMLKCAGKRSCAVGNIGAAFSSVADRLDATDIAVIEASSFQLESTRDFAPDIAVMLNITPDHLDRHGDKERYIGAKANIFLRQSESDIAVYNADDENVLSLLPVIRAQKVPFSVSHPVDGAYLSSGFLCFRGRPVADVAELDLAGRELEDALASVAAAVSAGVSAYTAASALATFKRPEFRRSACGRIDGVAVFNDSKSTNVYAAVSAAESMTGDTVIILGGADRGEDFSELFDMLPPTVKGAVATGENAEKILAAAREAGVYAVRGGADIAEACADALNVAKELGCENVLFSPASKSYDAYGSFVERGRAFDAAFSRLSSK